MKDLEFHVENRNQPTKIHSSFKEAAADAVSRAVTHGEEVTIDVVAWSKTAARAWGGEAVLRAESRGRIA